MFILWQSASSTCGSDQTRDDAEQQKKKLRRLLVEAAFSHGAGTASPA